MSILDGVISRVEELGVMRIAVTGGDGYIGSALVPYLRDSENHNVDVFDLPVDYRTLSAGTLAPYDVVVHLAGHSSVVQCTNDPIGAVQNNVTGFVELLDVLECHQKLIYASSGSVYHGCGTNVSEQCVEVHPRNLYDITKFAVDQIVVTGGRPKTYGLRFGTVSGPSPKTRWDLMVNAMVARAKQVGSVFVENGDAYRSILGLRDLTDAINLLIQCDDVPSGVYNLASQTLSISEIAAEVSAYFGVTTEKSCKISPHYDFGMRIDKFRKATGFSPTETVASICESFL